jgi:hypothetical protein
MKKLKFFFILAATGIIFSFIGIKTNKTDKCGCLIVYKRVIATDKNESQWYEKVCDDYDKWQGKNKLEEKYKKMYEGSPYKIVTGWTGDSFCE